MLTSEERDLYVSQRNKLGVDAEEIERLRIQLREKDRIISTLRREVDTLKEGASSTPDRPLLSASSQSTLEEGTAKEVHRLKEENARLRGLLKSHVASTRLTIFRLREGLEEAKATAETEKPLMVADFATCIAALDRIKQASLLADQMDRLYRQEVALRKQFQEMVQDLKGNIRVFCRVRPAVNAAGKRVKVAQENRCTVYSTSDPDALIANDPARASRPSKRYNFNKVFTESTSQSDVFTSIQPLVDSIVEGYNVCLFAYGQIGSGKSYTIMGKCDPQKPGSFTSATRGNVKKVKELTETEQKEHNKHKGVLERSSERLFSLLAEKKEDTSTVHISVLEIHCERIIDLLLPKQPTKLPDYKVKHGTYVIGGTTFNGTYVEDLTHVKVSTTADVMKQMHHAGQNRKETTRRSAAEPGQSQRHSRSHMIITLHVCTQNKATGAGNFSVLNVVDLAGSERHNPLDKGSTEEAKKINLSLVRLGIVFSALQQDDEHIKYRDSKLTHVVRDLFPMTPTPHPTIILSQSLPTIFSISISTFCYYFFFFHSSASRLSWWVIESCDDSSVQFTRSGCRYVFH